MARPTGFKPVTYPLGGALCPPELLTALDVLEINVSARSPEIQKTLMAEITKRRVFLESQGVV